MGKRRQYGDYRFIKDGMDRRAADYFFVVMEKQGTYTSLVKAENNIAFSNNLLHTEEQHGTNKLHKLEAQNKFSFA
jgi:hypothetical protein